MAEKPKIGVIRLDYDWVKTIGDIDAKDTYKNSPYEVIGEKVEGFTFVNAQEGLAPNGKFRDSFLSHEEVKTYAEIDPFERSAGDFVSTEAGITYSSDVIERNFLAALKRLEARGAVAITGNCGFMMNFQSFVAAHTDTPCLMSSLMQLPVMAGSLGKSCNTDGSIDKIIILTANSNSFNEAWDSLVPPEWGISKEQLLILGCQDIEGFGAEVAAGMKHDPLRAMPAMEEKCQKMIDDSGQTVKALLMECTELPHYIQPLRDMSGLPIYDVVTMIDFLQMGKSGTVAATDVVKRAATGTRTSFIDDAGLGWGPAVAQEKVKGACRLGVLRMDAQQTWNEWTFFADSQHWDHAKSPFSFQWEHVEGLSFKDCQYGIADDWAVETNLIKSEVVDEMKAAAKTYPKLQQVLDFYESSTTVTTIRDFDSILDHSVYRAALYLDILPRLQRRENSKSLTLTKRSDYTSQGDADGKPDRIGSLLPLKTYSYPKAVKERNLANAVAKLSAAGCQAIIGDCGFMHSIQEFVAKRTRIPVLVSPMLQLSFMISAIGTTGLKSQKPRKVAICVSEVEEFERNKELHIPQDCLDKWDRVRVIGFHDKDGFGPRHSIKMAGALMIKHIQDDIEAGEYELGAILLECPEFPLYKLQLRDAFDVPVRDMTSQMEYLRLGTAVASYSCDETGADF